MSDQRILIENDRELISHIKPILESKGSLLIEKIQFENLEINYKISLPFSTIVGHSLTHILHKNINDYIIEFSNCIFNTPFNLSSKKTNFLFSNKTIFKEDVRLYSSESNLTFENCFFKKRTTLKNSIFKGKIRFRVCEFIDETDFNNTTFHELADFWKSTFYKKVIFYKTDFNETAVFSVVTFHENVLFTYSLIDKLLLLRGTKCINGFDISLAIISGKLGVFDFKLTNYEVFEKELNEVIYEEYVSEKGVIPIKNKRETFRILKQNHESQNNVVESLPFKRMEKETLTKELSYKSGFFNFIDKIILKLNSCSNNYGTSITHSFGFILIMGWLFFYLSLIATDSFEYSCDISEWEFTRGLGYFIQFLMPTHKFNYMGDGVLLTTSFYFFDFIGRTFVGYGIYQFIQAFRKFR